ncbi:MAG: hypothetical protein LBE20_03605 [Deltaproteobacteria bacterium]|jgi:hypothetical protein|nr:hypothetical protein [Deltaproteobacteria bacterium]
MQESLILKKIMLALGQLKTLRIWRNNTGVLWSGTDIKKLGKDIYIKNAYPVRFGLEGSADILGIIAPDGKFLAIEVKQQRGRQSEKQKNFENMIKSLGGVYILAHSPEEALEKLKVVINVNKTEII